jgi:protein-disulfide isomerase
VTVTLVEDVGCLSCRSALAPQLLPALRDPVRRGEARLVFRNWNVLGPETTRGAKAALAAAEQDRYWHYLALLVRNRGEGTEWQEADDLLSAVARASGVDVERWEETVGSGERREWEAHLDRSAAIARANGIDRPPGYVVEGPGGKRVVRADEARPEAIARALAAVRRG